MKSSTKKCAYCGIDSPLTREHIWPDSLIKKYNEALKTYNKRTNNFYIGDPVIKDVCKTCNNTILNNLDGYISTLYDEYLYNKLSPGESASLGYNYDLLLRSLLKISYNSARANGGKKTIKTHKQFSKYILNGGYHQQIILRLQIVTASRIIIPSQSIDSTFEVTHLRCADIAFDGKLRHRFIVRMIAINSYWFYIIMSHRSEPKNKWREFMNGFCSWEIPPGILVNPSSSQLEIPVEKTTYMHPRLLGSLVDVGKNA